MSALKGTLRRIVYQGRGYWTVGKLETVDHQLVSVVGNLVAVTEGDSLQLTGEWVLDAKYGRQFRFDGYEVLAPAAEGVVAWLASALPEIGRARAIEMVKRFGIDQIFDVIENRPWELNEVDGITPARAEAIGNAYTERKAEQQQMVFLKRWQLTDYQCACIIDQYGAAAEDVIRSNPYRLMEISGFGFKTVDSFALRMGVQRDSIERAKAAALYMLNVAKQQGHTYVPVERLAARCAEDLDVPQGSIRDAVGILDEEGRIRARFGDSGCGVAVYLSGLRLSEGVIARRLAALKKEQAA